MFDFSIVTNWIHQMLTSVMPEGLAIFIECVVVGVCIVLMYAILAILLIYMERKICMRFLPVPSRSDPCGSLWNNPGYQRRAEDADQGNLHTEDRR